MIWLNYRDTTQVFSVRLDDWAQWRSCRAYCTTGNEPTVSNLKIRTNSDASDSSSSTRETKWSNYIVARVTCSIPNASKTGPRGIRLVRYAEKILLRLHEKNKWINYKKKTKKKRRYLIMLLDRIQFIILTLYAYKSYISCKKLAY